MVLETKDKDVSTSPGIRFAIPPLIFTGLSFAAGIVHWSLLGPESVWPIQPYRWHFMPGILLGFAGFGFMMSAWFHFRIIGTTVTTNAAASKLVETGAFRYSRNPMYVGFVTLLVAGSITFLSWAFLVASGLMLVYLDHYVIPREEQYLVAAFGDAYEAYCAKVRRWL